MGRPRFCGRVHRRLKPVARHLLLGWSNAQIAQELGIRQQTVRNYVKLVFDVAGADNREEAREIILHNSALLKEIYA